MSSSSIVFRRRTWLTALTVGLTALAAVYLTKGCYLLVLGEDRPGALRERWEEEQIILQGHTYRANSSQEVHLAKDDWHLMFRRDGTLHPKVRVPSLGGYPPWAFVVGTVLYGADFSSTRVIFAAFNVAAILALAVWSFSVGRVYGVAVAWLVSSATLAVSSICTTLGGGQIGILVVGSLAGALCALQKQRNSLAGLLLGLAMVKPTIAAMFVMVLVVKKAWKSVAVMLLFFAIGTSIAWAMTHCPLMDSLGGLLRAGEFSVNANVSVPSAMAAAGVDHKWILPVLGACGAIAGTLLMLRLRKHDTVLLFAVAAVFGRLITYHRSPDNVMLVFLLVPLAVLASAGGKKLAMATFLISGLSLWLPARAVDSSYAQIAQMIIWATSLVVLLLLVKDTGTLDAVEAGEIDDDLLSADLPSPDHCGNLPAESLPG